jgi:hypothetical protein
VGSKKIPAESVRLAECVGDVRALLRQILSDSVPSVNITRKTSKSRSMKSEYFNHLHLLRSVRTVLDTHVTLM